MRSDAIKVGVERAPHRALLKALGLADSDLKKPFMINPRFPANGTGKDIDFWDLESILDDIAPRTDMQPQIQILDLNLGDKND